MEISYIVFADDYFGHWHIVACRIKPIFIIYTLYINILWSVFVPLNIYIIIITALLLQDDLYCM